MNRNEQFVITINRELGSGGRTVGRLVAEKLGVPFLDKALIKALQEKYNLSVEEIEKQKGRKHDWWSEFKRIMLLGHSYGNSHYAPMPFGTVNGEFDLIPDDMSFLPGDFNIASANMSYPDMLTTDEMFEVEKEILKNIAEKESCIIAGRTGFHVFADHPNHLNIFIQASMEHRIERVMRKQNLSREETEKTIKKVDEMRENYVKKYAGTSRYDTRNYDLVISMDGKTEDEVADIIITYIGQ